MPMTKTVEVTIEQRVATVRLNRPDRLNALSADMPSVLRRALEDLESKDSVGAIILTGEGRGFCSGADLELFGDVRGKDEVSDYIRDVYRPLVLTMTGLDKPVVGAINGVAAGAGMGLALACDLRVMASDAAMTCAFVRLGLVPDAGVTWLLARTVGYSRALELALTGRSVPADECLQLGLADSIAEPDALLEQAGAVASKLAVGPQPATRLTKQLLRDSMIFDLDEIIGREARAQQEAVFSEDHEEGLQAVREKREANFRSRS